MTLFGNSFAKLIEVILPAHCVGCGRAGTYLCDTCLASMEAPLQPTITSDAYSFTSATSAFSYGDDIARTAVQRLKFRNLRAIAPAMGAPIAALIHDMSLRETPLDSVVPIPLHASRLRERGYNQALLLATTIAFTLQIPLGKDWLTRQRQSGRQVEAPSVAARQANVKDAFIATSAVANRRIALIDDVMTTGATLEAAAAALMHAGATAVHCYTFAKEE
jgi:ComF family protein